MKIEIHDVFCGHNHLKAMPAGWRTLVFEFGRKWVGVLDPYTLEVSRIRLADFDKLRRSPRRHNGKVIKRCMKKRLTFREGGPTNFMKRVLEALQ